MKKLLIPLFLLSILSSKLVAQYIFTPEIQLACTSVKSQDRTGTCWSFSTCSFLESELIRMGKGKYDLSEMFIVRNIYKDKTQNYLFRQGNASYGEGSLSHDVMRIIKDYGIVPESAYSGKIKKNAVYDHGELIDVSKKMLDNWIETKGISVNWRADYEQLLDKYLGKLVETFDEEGITYTPKTYAKELGIKPDDYITFTSYTHHPFYDTFILEIPDNYSNGTYWNIPIDELIAIIDTALANGYTVAWDGDVSEKSFSARSGMAILPTEVQRKDLFDKPGAELMVTQDLRQKTFENYSTTDDHLMHLVGIAKDQKGTKYYITKNSWGEISDFKGYLMMSEAFIRLKTVGIMVHKEIVPEEIGKKLRW